MPVAEFPAAPETDLPQPVSGSDPVPNFDDSADAMPEGLIPEEHTAEAGDWKIVRAAIECRHCGSNVFYHPEHIVPANLVQCFNCQHQPANYVWWETPRLSSFGGGEQR